MKKRWQARAYLGRDAGGKQQFKWLGRYDTKRERDQALAEYRVRPTRSGLPLCGEYVERYLAHYERRVKWSSYVSAKERLRNFTRDFGSVPLDGISREEAKDWVYGEGRWDTEQPRSYVQAVVSLYNYAIDEDDLQIERNPFRRLSRRSKGNRDTKPPTETEFRRLLNACSVLGDYGHEFRAMVLFAAYTLMRPGELFALEWTDIDFERMRINKARRLFRGDIDVPKTGAKLIALTPPARDALAGLRRRDHLVFHSRTGKRLTQASHSLTWREVRAAAGVDCTFYVATKHYGVHYMVKELGMSEAAVGAQAGWSAKTVSQMLETYGHLEIGALDEVDKAFKDAPKPKLQVIDGGKG